jgi:hypothetical protein
MTEPETPSAVIDTKKILLDSRKQYVAPERIMTNPMDFLLSEQKRLANINAPLIPDTPKSEVQAPGGLWSITPAQTPTLGPEKPVLSPNEITLMPAPSAPDLASLARAPSAPDLAPPAPAPSAPDLVPTATPASIAHSLIIAPTPKYVMPLVDDSTMSKQPTAATAPMKLGSGNSFRPIGAVPASGASGASGTSGVSGGQPSKEEIKKQPEIKAGETKKMPVTSVTVEINCVLSSQRAFAVYDGIAPLRGLPMRLEQRLNWEGMLQDDVRFEIPFTGNYRVTWSGQWDSKLVFLRLASMPPTAQYSSDTAFLSRADWINLEPEGRSRKYEFVAGDYLWVDCSRCIGVSQDAARQLPIKLIIAIQLIGIGQT